MRRDLLEQPTLRSIDISRISGITLRQLQWWDERHVVSPRQHQHHRLYEAEEAVVISVLAELRKKGFSLQKLRHILRQLTREIDRYINSGRDAELYLLTDGKGIWFTEWPDRIVQVMERASKGMLLVDVRKHTEQVRAALAGKRNGKAA